jgi:hypothetical protein
LRAAAERCLVLWHLASLDAATVAVVWSAGFAWAAALRVPEWALAMQALAVWAVYVVDRLLDTRRALGTRDLERLRERHFFHWRHRRVLGPAAVVAVGAAAGLILLYMPVMARLRNSALAAAALVYFARVHFRPDQEFTWSIWQCARRRFLKENGTRAHRPPLHKFLIRYGERDEDGARGDAGWLRPILTKEVLVGVLFTAGCALPAMGRMQSAGRGALLCGVGFFALLAWLNCRSIEDWEGEDWEGEGCGGTMAQRGRLHAGWMVAGVGMALAALLAAHERAAALVLAGALSALLLVWLDGRRRRMSPVLLRAAADLVLLTPLLLLLIARMGR